MSATTVGASTAPTTAASTRLRTDPAFQAFTLLRIGFTVAPIAFGLDKFFGLLTDWDKYLSSFMNDILPGTAHTGMYLIGIIEIVAGLAVALQPRFGGYLVALWLGGRIFNLLLLQDYYDVALRDFGLLLAALTLARLATAFPQGPATRRA